MIKYFCDYPGCEEELNKNDPINLMLDVIGKVFCKKHLAEYNKQQEEYRGGWIYSH